MRTVPIWDWGRKRQAAEFVPKPPAASLSRIVSRIASSIRSSRLSYEYRLETARPNCVLMCKLPVHRAMTEIILGSAQDFLSNWHLYSQVRTRKSLCIGTDDILARDNACFESCVPEIWLFCAIWTLLTCLTPRAISVRGIKRVKIGNVPRFVIARRANHPTECKKPPTARMRRHAGESHAGCSPLQAELPEYEQCT
jgi:hypothetical protein